MNDHKSSRESIEISHASRETVAPSNVSDSVPASTGPFAQLPAKFGRLQVLKLLGHGAMGTVYLAFDSDLGKEVALKIPKADLSQDALLWERFQREARAVGDLNHPHICGMYEVGQVDGTHYISMEYVNGRALSDFVGENLPQRKAVSVIRKLASGLAHAHERGIVHRDLKPANVMIDAAGDPKLMDFGLARRLESTDVRATQSGMIVGSPAYMSPEQARAEHDKIGPGTDIYGLGVLMFELLTGSLPFQGPVVVVLGQIATQLPPRPSTLRKDVDPQLESLCLKMLAKLPQDRPKSMTDVIQTLEDWAQEQSTGSADPNVAILAKEESSPLVPARAPVSKPEKDPIEAQKQRVNELLKKHQYVAAIELLDKIVNLKDARFEKLVAWGRERLPEVQATEQKMREASEPLCATAEKLLKRHDYAEAVKVLSSVPMAYRSPDLREMLRQSTELKEECEHLEQDIADAIQQGDADALSPLVKRLLKLKPGSKAIKQLAEDLKKYGAKKVVARRKGQKRILDSSDRMFETKHLIGSVVLIAGLFLGVTLLVRNYLAKDTTAGGPWPPPPPPGPTPPGPGLNDPPPKPAEIAKSPFDASTAAKHQTAWGSHLNIPVAFTNATGMKFRLIPPGEFEMGRKESLEEVEEALKNYGGLSGVELSDEVPRHRVGITSAFLIGTFEVTKDQFSRFANEERYVTDAERTGKGLGIIDHPTIPWTSGPAFSWRSWGVDQQGDCPVTNVSWNDANQFCQWLNRRDRREGAVPKGWEYRLPSEAEWEYVARAGTDSIFANGNNPDQLVGVGNVFDQSISIKYPGDISQYSLKSSDGFVFPCSVGKFAANAFGVHDLTGNLSEWCADWYQADYYSGSPADSPGGPSTGVKKVVRGGHWAGWVKYNRVAFRSAELPNYFFFHHGFRVVCGPPLVLSKPSDTPVVKPGGSIPDVAEAPFTAAEAKVHQANWAKHLKISSELSTGNLKMVIIPPGKFQMGLPKGTDVQETASHPQHPVTITQPFLLAATEVTQQVFQRVTGRNPSAFAPQGRHRDRVQDKDTSLQPVESVSWYDAVEFCNQLSTLEELPVAYTLSGVQRDTNGRITSAVIQWNRSSSGYRLPTDAEWEYACRAGTTSPYWFNDPITDFDKYARSQLGAEGLGPDDVGKRLPNPFGLFDIYGNVCEYCYDQFDRDWYAKSPVQDPVCETPQPERAVRGGSWGWWMNASGSGTRRSINPAIGGDGEGFRVARSLQFTKTPPVPSPTQISGEWPTAGLMLHVDPSNVNSVTTKSQIVQKIADQSGRNNDLTPHGSGDDVKLTPNAIGGRPAMTFNNGKSLGPAKSDPFANNQLSMFIVIRPTAIDAWNFVAGKDTYSWGDGYGVEITTQGVGAFVANGPETRHPVAPNATYVLSAVKDDKSMRLWIDGTLRTTHTQFTSFNPASHQYRIGNSDNISPAWGLTGHIGEVLHYDRAVSDNERTAIEKYLNGKWQSRAPASPEKRTNVSSWKKLHEIQMRYNSHLAFSDDGSVLVGGGGIQLHAWKVSPESVSVTEIPNDLADSSPIPANANGLTYATVSPDGRYVLSASYRTTQVWDRIDNKLIKRTAIPGSQSRYAVALSADLQSVVVPLLKSGPGGSQRYAVNTYTLSSRSNGSITLIDLPNISIPAFKSAITANGSRIAVVLSQNRVATASLNDAATQLSNMQMIDLGSDKPTGERREVESVCISGDGRIVATLSSNRKHRLDQDTCQERVEFWDALTGKPHAKPIELTEQKNAWSQMCLNGDGTLISVGPGLYDVQTGEQSTIEGNPTHGIACFSQTGRYCAGRTTTAIQIYGR